jgi:hypothetical protein
VTAHKKPEAASCGCNLRIEKDIGSIRLDQNYINTHEDVKLLLSAYSKVMHSIWDHTWVKQLHNHKEVN